MTTAPRRYQLRRGLPRMGLPEGIEAVRVSRPTRWGNPYDYRVYGHAQAAALFRQHLLGSTDLLAAARRDLRGRDLACWCPLNGPCHAEVLLEIANPEKWGPPPQQVRRMKPSRRFT